MTTLTDFISGIENYIVNGTGILNVDMRAIKDYSVMSLDSLKNFTYEADSEPYRRVEHTSDGYHEDAPTFERYGEDEPECQQWRYTQTRNRRRLEVANAILQNDETRWFFAATMAYFPAVKYSPGDENVYLHNNFWAKLRFMDNRQFNEDLKYIQLNYRQAQGTFANSLIAVHKNTSKNKIQYNFREKTKTQLAVQASLDQGVRGTFNLPPLKWDDRDESVEKRVNGNYKNRLYPFSKLEKIFKADEFRSTQDDLLNYEIKITPVTRLQEITVSLTDQTISLYEFHVFLEKLVDSSKDKRECKKIILEAINETLKKHKTDFPETYEIEDQWQSGYETMPHDTNIKLNKKNTIKNKKSLRILKQIVNDKAFCDLLADYASDVNQDITIDDFKVKYEVFDTLRQMKDSEGKRNFDHALTEKQAIRGQSCSLASGLMRLHRNDYFRLSLTRAEENLTRILSIAEGFGYKQVLGHQNTRHVFSKNNSLDSILKSLQARHDKIAGAWGFFKDKDISVQKAAMLQSLIDDISKKYSGKDTHTELTDVQMTELSELLEAWEQKKESIDNNNKSNAELMTESRSRSLFSKDKYAVSTTQAMFSDLNKDLGRLTVNTVLEDLKQERKRIADSWGIFKDPSRNGKVAALENLIDKINNYFVEAADKSALLSKQSSPELLGRLHTTITEWEKDKTYGKSNKDLMGEHRSHVVWNKNALTKTKELFMALNVCVNDIPEKSLGAR